MDPRVIMTNDIATWPVWHFTLLYDSPEWDEVTLKVKCVTWEDSCFVRAESVDLAFGILKRVASANGDVIVWHDVAEVPDERNPQDILGL